MCGIVGATATRNVLPLLIEGLSRLEYRGYDSAGIAMLDAQGRVYVSDMAACQIFVYDADGKYLRSIGARGDLPGQFARPKGVAVDKAGRVYVVDAAADVCQVFDAEGQLLLFFGEPTGSPAPLSLPAAVIVDDQNLAAFQKYAAPDFVLEQLVVIANQYGNRKISVYGLGHPR